MSDISVSGITKQFVLKDRTITAVDDISLSIQDGDFITVVGPSGCGKSTLLHIIGGLLEPDKGSISFEKGTGRCGFVFQEPRLLNSATVRQNLLLAMKHIKSNKEKEQVLSDTLSFLELLEFIDAYPNQLSGGMAQRAAIGRALCRQPDVMLMDEPFSALDAFLRKKLQDELINLYQNRNLTIVFVTHDVSEAVYLGKKVAIMNAGRIEKVIDVDMDYPRKRSGIEFNTISETILDTIAGLRK
ncbi:MAG: ABC transporter ATP-binding protein [Spirochaetia bacterium]|nr:ABC transporter ATP-binding protein [Spirochaetia bacterium]MBQ3648316.1 ABC transporter ATP-binding protein [Spirochaetia bacterium]MBQ3712625.1 ABC transporter ATP-binding protein [Spirochaetia bacterium]MBQ6674348.1 ABC transporter ATP-binding protein [Spirochaetia bacterium]MBQ6905004.1 ABC transporter ATP-binding protein [Spirochaetia bacterium]